MGTPYDNYCTPEHLKRENWYSKTYAAKISVNGTEPQDCDLVHIRIPLQPEKESAAIKQFGLNKEDMPNFYDWMWKRVKNHVRTLRDLNRGNVSDLVVLYKADIVKDEESATEVRNIFLLTPQYRTYRETVADTSVPLSAVIGAGIRISNLIRNIAAANIVHGNICMDALYVDDNNKIILGDFFYSMRLNTEEEQPNPYKYIVPPHVPEYIISRGICENRTDVYAAASLLWNLLCEIPADVRTPYRIRPALAPNELVFVLTAAMNESEESALQTFRKGISELMRTVQKGNDVDIKLKVSGYVPQYAPIAKKNIGLTERDIMAAILQIEEA